MLPRITVDGRVAADPELRFGQNGGTAVARLRVVASDRRKNDKTGEWEDADTLWIDVTAFKQLAENVVESVAKGDLVVVTGKIRTEEWVDRDSGQKRSKVTLIADTVAASLQFRTIPHGGGTKTERVATDATRNFVNPVTQAYGEEPPF